MGIVISTPITELFKCPGISLQP